MKKPDDNVVDEKLNKAGIRDHNGYRMRAACVCIKQETLGIRILLITSRRNVGKWVMPGGGIEDGEDGLTAAKREALEEAGVVGSITNYLGCFEDSHARNRTFLFILDVCEELIEWNEREGRSRRWFDLIEARILLEHSKPSQILYLDALERHLRLSQISREQPAPTNCK